MTVAEALRLVGPPVAALLAAIAVDRMAVRRNFDPPGFRSPARRLSAIVLVAATLYAGVFSPLGTFGQGAVPLGAIEDWQLFALQILFVATLLGWFALGFVNTRPVEASGALAAPDVPAPAAPATGGGQAQRFAAQFGLATSQPGREIGFGAVAGIAAWLIVLAGVLVVVAILSSLFGEELLPQQPPPLIPWIAGRSVALRLAIALTAGVVEETFFRGFLQPRIGIALSTALFAMAHLSYDQPLMLVGITLLSLLYGGLVRWRQNLWPAIVAHFLFDAIQLLVVIPAVLKLVYPQAGAP